MVWCIEIQETEHLEEALNIIFYLNNDYKERNADGHYTCEMMLNLDHKKYAN